MNFTGNTGTEFGGESNLYLGSGLFANLEGGMGEKSMVGVYTTNVPTNSSDVKFAVNASKGYAAHFVSDKMETAGVIYDDGAKCWDSDGNEVLGFHHTNEANTLWLSTAAAVVYEVAAAKVGKDNKGVQAVTENELGTIRFGWTLTFDGAKPSSLGA